MTPAPEAPPSHDGQDLYNRFCYYCHGYDGDGKTIAARFLDPPPRDFTRLKPREGLRDRMLRAVRGGRPGSAMEPFRGILGRAEIEAIVDYVLGAFVEAQRPNTAYHIEANGWFDHERYRAAYPFALGEIALDTPDERLTEVEQAGKRLFMASCITCHDRAHVEDDRTVWEPRAVSWPRAGYSHRESGPAAADARSGATPFRRHDELPAVATSDDRLVRGGQLFQENCAFCHAADGSGRNWIGSFIEPRPRDLRDRVAIGRLGAASLRARIADGVPETAMPAWRTVLSPEDIDAVAAYVEQVLAAP